MSFSLTRPESLKRLFYGFGALVFLSLITAGMFARNGWFPQTDAMSGKRTGWFGKPLAQNAPSSWNPIPLPEPTPQLSKEYIYAGSRLLTVEDVNASAAPPADLAVWRPSTGVWYVLLPVGWTDTSWGQGADPPNNIESDIPVPGDYDGDGKTDFSVFRPGDYKWYIFYSSSGGISDTAFGQSGDIPAQADYDGDGKTDAAVFRPGTTCTWYILGSSAGFYSLNWGVSGDIPVPADYDGDGKADLAVWRTSNRKFYSINSSNSAAQTIDTTFTPSSPTWVAASGDYDGDGKADYGVYDQSAANWYIRSSISGTFPTNPVQWGAAGDTAVHNDYDADGKVDYAVWTPTGTNVGRWHIKNSSDASTRNVTWGIQYDIPVPALYRR